MERKVQIGDWQKVTQEDFDNFGEFPRESFDDLISNVLIPDKAYAGFGVTESGTAEVTVAEGRLLYSGAMYLNNTAGGTVVNLLSYLPTATQKYVAVTAYGTEEDTETEPRTYLTDATTRATIAKAVATESRRWANISVTAGAESTDPQYPAVAENVVAIAYVLLDATGVVSITMNATDAVPTLREADTRLNAFDVWQTGIGTAIDTLRSDLAGLAAKLFGTAKQQFVLDIARDLARTKEQLSLPDNYVSWATDHFLDDNSSDLAHPDWLSVNEEGGRFPNAAVEDTQIGLLNQYDPNANQQDFFVLPAYTESARITVDGNDDQVNISTYQYQTVNYTLKKRARTRWRFGPWFNVCSNWTFYTNDWRYGTSSWVDRAEGIFSMQGDTWQLDPRYSNPENHTWVRIRQVWKDSWEEYYLQEVVSSTNVSGSILAQTFLNSQDGWLTSLDLQFTAVAASGDVTVMICETTNGSPDYGKVVKTATLSQADMEVYPTVTNVAFVPTFLSAGQRYSIVLSTPSNHYVAVVENNKYAQGSLFYSTDEAWFMGDLEKDLAFTAYFAKFDSPRVEIQLNSLTLTNGIGGIDILCEAAEPPQSFISWEVQVSGAWISLNTIGAWDTNPVDPFNGLPALLPFRAVLVGTVDSMPGFGVGSNSRVRTRRARTDMKHISKQYTVDSSNNVVVDVRLEGWRGGPYHTEVTKLLWGDSPENTETYDTLVEIDAPDDPTGNTIIRTYTFSGLSADTYYRVRIEGTTDNALQTWHIAERTSITTTV